MIGTNERLCVERLQKKINYSKTINLVYHGFQYIMECVRNINVQKKREKN